MPLLCCDVALVSELRLTAGCVLMDLVSPAVSGTSVYANGLNKKWQVSNVKNNQFIHYNNAFPASSLGHCLINSANKGSNVKETIRPTP